MALASAACSRALPDDDTGKNKSGSADQQAATDRQSCSAINMAVPFFVMFADQYRVGAVLWVNSFMTLAFRRDA
jgi:hypothetical protein